MMTCDSEYFLSDLVIHSGEQKMLVVWTLDE